LDYTAFEQGVMFTMRASNVANDDIVAGLFGAEAEFTIRLGDTPGNDYLERYVNAYDITADPDTGADGHIGGYNSVTGTYEIGGSYDAAGNQVMHIDGRYELFDSLWIDGVKRIRYPAPGYEYIAEERSTRVTILAKTIKSLDDGEHVAAAAFRRDDGSGEVDYVSWNLESESGDIPNSYLDVVAQRFTVKLLNRSGNTGNTGNPVYPSYPGYPASPGYSTGSGQSGATVGNNTGSNQNAATAGSSDGGAGESGTANDATTVVAPPNEAEVTAPPDADAVSEDTESTENTADTDTTAHPDTDASLPDAPALPAPPAEAVVAAPPQETAELPEEENTVLRLEFPADGGPLTVRIELPLAEFNDLYLDDMPLVRGADYTATEGSTVLAVAGNVLAALETGEHSLTAGFDSGDVRFMFTVPAAAATGGAPNARKEALVGAGVDDAVPAAPAPAIPGTETDATGGAHTATVVVICAAVSAAAGAVVVLRRRRNRV
jgi:hypothetical protein